MELKKETPKAERWASTILAIMGETIQTFKHNHDGVHEKDLETSDILHEIEFASLNVVQRIKLFNRLREVRQDRRKMKNENEMLTPIYELFKASDTFKDKLSKAYGRAMQIKNIQDGRVYVPRIRHDVENTEETELPQPTIEPKGTLGEKLDNAFKNFLVRKERG